MADSINLFFSEERTMKKPTPVQARQVILWKCGVCGANLLTGERRGANIVNNSVECSNCRATNELIEIKWSGQP
jgi:hypothetical protein